MIGSAELVNRLLEVLATEAPFISVFDVENSPLDKGQFISNFFSCTGELMEYHTMQANAELLVFLENSNYDYYIHSSDA
jgi:6-phosphogluconate dehydrogenase (decarboxylating)